MFVNEQLKNKHAQIFIITVRIPSIFSTFFELHRSWRCSTCSRGTQGELFLRRAAITFSSVAHFLEAFKYQNFLLLGQRLTFLSFNGITTPFYPSCIAQRRLVTR